MSSEEDKVVNAQARPNVLYEAGMAMAKAPSRTILIEVGAHRKFSDIDGRHLLRLDNSGEKRNGLVQRLQSTGCVPDTSGTHWLSAGDFSSPVVVEGFKVAPMVVGSGPAPTAADLVEKDGITVAIQGIKSTGSGTFVARGRVSSVNPGMKAVRVTATYFSENGEILGTATGSIRGLGTGETMTIELLSFDNLAQYHSQSVQIDSVR